MPIRSDILDELSSAVKDAMDGTVGETLSYTQKELAAISLTGFPSAEDNGATGDYSLNAQETDRTFQVPAQAGLLAFITTKALTTNVVTLTTREAHGFVTGQTIRVVLDTADTVFDGIQVITTVPTTTTFTYAKTNANVTSVAATGFTESKIFVGDKITFESHDYEIRRVSNAGIRVLYKLDCAYVQPQAAGVN